MILLKILTFMFCLQKELTYAVNMAIKLYCEDILKEGERSPAKM
jgi:hypothetical protein